MKLNEPFVDGHRIDMQPPEKKFYPPLIKSFLDDDLYKFNMGSVIFHHFPRARVQYKFYDRGNISFPPGFAIQLSNQVNQMANLSMTDEEEAWFKKIPYVRPTYVEWLKGFRMDPSEVLITQSKDKLDILIAGPWYRTIFWEVKLMAVISELYYMMVGDTIPSHNWVGKMVKKGEILEEAGCRWIDFGTRRRYSRYVQETLVRAMMKYKGFLGTSNVHLAHKYGLTAHGTYAHECIMAMMAIYGVKMADKEWRKIWAEHFEGDVGIALTDTFTTDFFLKHFNRYDAHLYDGLRQDSGDPYEWVENKVLPYYKKARINPIGKRLVFSDNLCVAPADQIKVENKYNYVAIDLKYRNMAIPVGGIGTHFTNDVGYTPLNMVIKMVSADFGFGYRNVAKLSDDKGKHTGNIGAIAEIKRDIMYECN